jgi:hypothetical protein
MPDDMADGGLARHPRGWRVAPAPDGRGTPPAQAGGGRRPRFGRFGWFVLVLLAVNWLSVLLFGTRQPSRGWRSRSARSS